MPSQMASMGGADSAVKLAWNLDNLDIRSKSVQQTLEPLVRQVTTLCDGRSERSGRRDKKKAGRVKKAQVLVVALQRAIEMFVDRGNEIAGENADAADQLGRCIADVRQTGGEMVDMSRDFAADPTSTTKRAAMVKAARSLLSAVTRLLIMADMIDVQLIVGGMRNARQILDKLNKATSQQEVLEKFRDLQRQVDSLDRDAKRRAADLKDTADSDRIHSARAILKTTCPMLHTACKAYARHPELDPARLNRDFAVQQIMNALSKMEDALSGTAGPDEDGAAAAGRTLAMALNEFDQHVFIEPVNYNYKIMRPSLEAELEKIVSQSALIADSDNTREDRKNRIVQECNAVRQALQDLLTEYERNVGAKEASETLEVAQGRVGRKTRDLRRHLRRAIIDHVSDSYLDTQIPLLLLIDAASRGNVPETEEAAVAFLEHAHKLVQVAKMTCRMSSEGDYVKIVGYAAMQVDKLAPQVVNAARLLVACHKSKPAQENMNAFKEAWEDRVHLLTMAVDSLISLDDFLAVSEAHIVEDIKNCIQAAVQKDADLLDHSAGAIRGRSLRICQVVDAEMELRPLDAYSTRVKQALKVLREGAVPRFASKAESAVQKMGQKLPGAVDIDEFIDVCSVVHKAVQDIRHAVLMNREPGDIDSDEEYEYAEKEVDKQQQQPSDNRRELMQRLPEEEKKKIQEQIDVFKVVQHKFEKEVAKWDESGNELVVLAKYMCMIMLQMTDFTRGQGPLKSTMDVINAAKLISEAGSKLNALAKQIATDCVESETKKDLLAYLQRITLYCHQLNITSKVKADVQQVGDELIASALESATSLIQAAKNLLNSVVLTVKSAYIASTKYPSKLAKDSSVVVWKMRPPGKKPLVMRELPPSGQTQGIIRRASQRRDLQPVKILSQFSTATGDNF